MARAARRRHLDVAHPARHRDAVLVVLPHKAAMANGGDLELGKRGHGSGEWWVVKIAGEQFFHYSLLTTHYSLLTTHYSLLTTHYSLLTTHYSLLTTHYSLLTTHYSLLTTHYSLLTTHYSLLTTHYSLLTPSQAARPSNGVGLSAASSRHRTLTATISLPPGAVSGAVPRENAPTPQCRR